MLSSVELNINDSRAGVGSGAGTGNHCKVGVSSIQSSTPIEIRSSMDIAQIRSKLGNSPLADAVIDSIENGASLIYCLPVRGTTNGTVSEAVHLGTGTGTVAVSGNPTNSFTLIVRIETGGVTNEATCVISQNGGDTWGEEQTVPASGKIEVEGTGITLTFTAGDDKKFVAGDTYTFTATAPAASNEDILKAVDVLRGYKASYEFIHIVGTTTAALWASLETVGSTWENAYGRPVVFIVEQRAAAADEGTADYVEAILGQAKGIRGRHVAVVRSWLRYTRMDGQEQDINFAGILCGWLARSSESTSVAYVGQFSLPEEKVAALLPAGIEEYLEPLEGARYIELRTYNGLEGYYVASANMTIDESSEFSKLEDCRVAYRIARETYQRALRHQNEDFDQTDLENALIQVEADLNVPMDEAVDDKIISEGRTSILMDEVGGEGDKTLPVRIEYVPRGYVRKIILNMYVVNALAG